MIRDYIVYARLDSNRADCHRCRFDRRVTCILYVHNDWQLTSLTARQSLLAAAALEHTSRYPTLSQSDQSKLLLALLPAIRWSSQIPCKLG